MTAFSSPHASRERLTAAIASNAAPHLKPILLACRDYGVAWATVSQKAGQFDVPTDRPTVLVLGDDVATALGPAAFHRRSVRRFAARCRAAVIVSCEPMTELYAMAASCAAGMRRDALVVETQPRWESDWADLIRTANPSVSMVIGAVRPEGGVH